ncbi:MAG TPA: MarR family transcriptional regulator [Ktedonobacteraceae bacterium]|jgi:DNA-binding MarR family transcriptional regulator
MQPIEELRYLILAAQREGGRMLAEALRPLNLTAAQAEVLRVLQDHQPLSLVALGELLICESGSPSRLVNGLVEAGLVARIPSPLNGRKVILTLTPDGLAKAAQVHSLEDDVYRTLAEQFIDAPLPAIITVLRKFVEGRPAGDALARRIGRVQAHQEL